MDIDEVTAIIIDAALELHRGVGPGLMEKFYVVVLADELRARGLKVEQEVWLPFSYKGRAYRRGLKLDLLVEDAVVVEVKSAQQVIPVFLKQLLTYLRVLDLRVGLLINFGEATLKSGLRRVVNAYVPSAASSASPRLRVIQRKPDQQASK